MEATLIPLLIANLLVYVGFTVYALLTVLCIDGANLRVSNFCKEIVIPLSQVQHVQEVKQFKQKLIVLTLNRPHRI